MNSIKNLDKKSAAARLGLAPECSWEKALERFNEKRARIYSEFVLPLSEEDKNLLQETIAPYYEALRVLFPVKVMDEQSLRQYDIPQKAAMPEAEPVQVVNPPAPVADHVTIAAGVAPGGWRLFFWICTRAMVLFPGFAVGLSALLVTAWWKYGLITDVFSALFHLQGHVFFPALCVFAIEGGKIFTIVVQEYWKVERVNVRPFWSKVIKWLQISVFIVSVIGAAGLIKVLLSTPQTASEMSPALASVAAVQILIELTGMTTAGATILIGFMLAAILDLCIYALLSSVAFEVLRAKPQVPRLDETERNGRRHQTAFPQAGIVLALICLGSAALWGFSKYSKDAFAAGYGDTAERRLAGATEVSADWPQLYVTMNNLNLREKPARNADVITTLALHEQVLFLREKTEQPEVFDLGKGKFMDYWVKIRTQSGQQGWVIGAGVHYFQINRME